MSADEWTKMQRALEADGEKLRQLTGEDHGPKFLILINCRACGGEGRVLKGHPNDPHPRDCGPCPTCDGTGIELAETEGGRQ